MNESSQNFCRVCFLKDDENFSAICGTLSQMELLSVGNIEVFEEDGLPNLICMTCKIILANAYKFKQLCKRSETLLKNYQMTGIIPPKLHIPQEPLPSNKKEEPVIKPPEPKETKSIAVGTDEIELKSIGTGCENIEVKSTSVGCDIDVKESSTQTDKPMLETIEHVEMIATNEIDNFESIPIIAPPTLFEDETSQFTITKIEGGSSKPIILSNEKVKILNKATPDVSSTPAKQFKKKSTKKQESSAVNKPTILNSQLKIPKFENQIIETIEETPDGNIEIITYDEEYLEEDLEKKDMKPEEMDKSEDGVVYACDVCDRGFPLLQQLELHKENHTRARDHPCEYCEKAFFTKYDLAKHILTHTKQKDYTCIVCNKSFSRSTLLYRHEKIHTDPDIPRYQCSQCDRVYLNKLDYEKHQTTHAKNRPFACMYCDKKFAFKQGLERHEVIHDMESMPNSCQYCSDRFKTAARLQRHLSAAHAGTRAFPCSKCNKRFMLSHHLYRHMRTSHKTEDETITLQCPECEENFIQRDLFFDHCLEHATETLVCPMCKFAGDDNEDINNHILLHSKSDMYFCDYCSCIFMSQDVLNEHFVDKHSEELCGIVEDETEYIDKVPKQQIKREKDKSFKTPEVPSKRQKVSYEIQHIDNNPMGAVSFVEYEEEIQEPIKTEKQPVKAVNIRKEEPKPTKSSPTTTIQRVKMSLSEIKRLQKEGKIVMQDGMLVMKQ